MKKKRVYELAKELELGSKELISLLHNIGIEVKSHMCTLDADNVKRVRESVNKTRDSKPDATPQPKQTAEKTRQKSEPEAKGDGVRLSQYGPGLVDKVPQRPPDRRLIERPVRGIPASGEKKTVPTREQTSRDKQARPAEEAGTKTHSSGKGREIERGQQPRATEASRKTPGQGAREQSERSNAAQPTRTDSARRPFDGKEKREFGRQGGPAATRPESRSGSRVPSGRRPGPLGRGPIPSKAIPKPPAELEADKPDKSVGQQRFVDKKVKERSTWQDRWSKKKTPEKKIQHPPRRPGVKVTPTPPVQKKPVVISGDVSVKELAEKMGIKAAEIIKKLMHLGTMATINEQVDPETAAVVAQEFGVSVEIKEREPDFEERLELDDDQDDSALLRGRPPVVTVLGHVDHGKTSLLDAIRDENVTASEAGGITQHIGAYQVQKHDKRITFVDTPGHAAFTAMRARGASITDIAILVVAADDGVKPQTIEAINHAKAAQVPIVVAINKMDKPDVNPDRVKQQLTEYELVPEEWGGETICVPVSAHTKDGLDDLLEMILLVSEMHELKANPDRLARGTVIESQLDKGRGPVATVLVQNGTLKPGDILVSGSAFCRVRAMIDYRGRRVKEAGPSMPVEVLGFSEVPPAGERFYVVEDERVARQIVEKRQQRKREEDLKLSRRLSLEEVFERIKEGEVKELPLIVKADVQGSVEALVHSLEKLGTDEVQVQLAHYGAGGITETDVMLAAASNAIIIGFNVRPDANARKAAEREKVDIRTYKVIYEALDDVKAALSGLLDPQFREAVLGYAEVRQTFTASRIGTIAGCYVLEGKIARDAKVRIIRDGTIVHEGELSSLKRFKDDAREVAQGYECGVTLDRFNDLREGDQLEFFVIEEIKRELE